MTAPLAQPIVCPILVGRDAQVATIDQLIAEARAGAGHIAVISGEAGVGKSRLVAEAGRRASAHGFTVFRGRCFEDDRALPYAPLIDLLRGYLGACAPDALAPALGPAAPHLIDLLPEFAAPPARLPIQDPDSDQARRRIAHAFVQFFGHAAAGQPRLVIVEDLHWSDEASLATLLTLARQSAAQPLLLLLTYRDDEAQPNLVQMLGLLDRERRASTINLACLHYAEIDAMLRAIFRQRHPIRSEFLAAIQALTDGNPFFIEEVLKALVTSGAIFYANGQWDRKPLSELNIPPTIQTAVRQRVDLLSPTLRRVLILAAVAGRRFDFGLLQQLTGYDETKLIDAIKQLVAAQLVVEESTETFAFRHALTREALYAGLLARERKALHGTIASALEALAQKRGGEARDLWAADLARHCYAAGRWPQVLEYAGLAAAHAQRLYAPRAAIEHLSRAIDAAQQLGPTVPAKLYRDRGQMHETLGEFEGARDDYQAALASAQALGDRHAEWQALLDLGFLWAERDYVKMGEYRQRALTLARTLDDPAALGRSLNRIGNWHLFVEQPNEALRFHQEALELFRNAGDRPGLAATYDLLGVTNLIGCDIPAGVQHYHQAVALFRELNDLPGLSSSLSFFSTRGACYLWVASAWPLVDPAACIRDGEEALRIARQIGWRAGEAAALVCLAAGHGPRGEYPLALARASAALEIAKEIEHTSWTVGANNVLGALALDLLAPARARDHLEPALELVHELGAFFERNVAGYLASVYIAQRDFARAEQLLATSLPPGTPIDTQGQRSTWCAHAELALAAGDPAQALQIVDRLIGSTAHAEAYGAGCVPRLWHLRGEALAALGRPADAEAALVAASQGAAQRELHPIRWRIHTSLGRLYQSQARRKQAEAAFTTARTIVEALAAAMPDQALREGFLHGARALWPRPPAPTPRREARNAFEGLTAREREIAALIAQGRINREIADALVVGERTVETHISNILGKLDFTSRRQIAAWAIEKGLAKRVE